MKPAKDVLQWESFLQSQVMSYISSFKNKSEI